MPPDQQPATSDQQPATSNDKIFNIKPGTHMSSIANFKYLTLGAMLMALAAPAHAQLGIGKVLDTGLKLKELQITDEQEREIGTLVSEKIRQRYGVVQDKDVHRYVTLVGAALASSSTRPSGPWQFIVLDTDGVNAFAAPGGFVHITRGALALVRNEAELACVLGHEISHVTEQHTMKAIKKGNAKDLGMEMGPGSGLTREVISRIADRATDMVMAGFGRAEELEADEDGLALANKVGYAPTGLGDFLGRLAERNKDAAVRQGLFASHPETKERLDRLSKQIAREKLTAAVMLEDRYHKAIAYELKPKTEIAMVEAGAAGLAGGDSKAGSEPAKSGDAKAEEKPKKRGFGLASLVKPGGEEKKSAQVTGSAGARGADPERDAKGGPNPAIVATTVTPADIAAFKKEGKLA
jgi:predicted Zn-dependent protease